ncbi:macrophage-capping protein [Carassius auratus]|uniref:Macrophage-capping protein n=1 Tax=Carassius auratus TaxID=7957 RepID=A0A6P6K2K0_CARAU|nr:macrophage-capping protein-like [Carassius auratus]XP_026066406.1 macrophage-capping protein-like [Carassius auratus]XP_026066407.1 macrophage-capping protein-like [Carassius auratus]XP_026066408.1 macrophage-capping protein-like [Carassius auratus]
MLNLRTAQSQFTHEVREPGLYVWRVEKMKAVLLEPSQRGIFYNGDSYIVLGNRGKDGSDLHMWMGEKSSRDEQGACAMLATQLDSFLGGEPVQHRQVQGYESPEFMGLFPKGVSYKEGGVDSGFKNARTRIGPVTHLYQVKGKKNIRAREVELSWGSFNKGDCFILDLGETIVTWRGSKANMFERQKVREIAMLIRDTERNGKAQIIDVTEGEEPLEMVQALGPIPALKDGSTEEDADADITNSASLYKVSNTTGQMILTKLCDKGPFSQELLEKNGCFILDNGSSGKIYIWKGNGANADVKTIALKVADEFITEMNYPRMRTQVEILPQGRESVLFKQFFKSWR